MIQTEITTKIEQAFRNVQATHMKDMPVINDKLSIKCFGFAEENRFQGYRLGVLLTPWFMNLMLIPDQPPEDEAATIGDIRLHAFPSGSYEFVTGYDEAFGHYESCTLFAPMFEFPSQETAELSAQTSLLAIMNANNRDSASTNSTGQIRKLWQGANTQSDSATRGEQQNTEHKQRKLLSERMKETTSRRDFLRGKLFRSGD